MVRQRPDDSRSGWGVAAVGFVLLAVGAVGLYVALRVVVDRDAAEPVVESRAPEPEPGLGQREWEIPFDSVESSAAEWVLVLAASANWEEDPDAADALVRRLADCFASLEDGRFERFYPEARERVLRVRLDLLYSPPAALRERIRKLDRKANLKVTVQGEELKD